jgi:hypothetical protein
MLLALILSKQFTKRYPDVARSGDERSDGWRRFAFLDHDRHVGVFGLDLVGLSTIKNKQTSTIAVKYPMRSAAIVISRPPV